MCDHISNLRVITVILLGGPSPTLVCAVSRNTYTVSGDNPSTVPISMFNMLLPKLLVAVSLNCIEYCVIMPLGGTGGLHCKVTELGVMETICNDRGSLGATEISKNLHN